MVMTRKAPERTTSDTMDAVRLTGFVLLLSVAACGADRVRPTATPADADLPADADARDAASADGVDVGAPDGRSVADEDAGPTTDAARPDASSGRCPPGRATIDRPDDFGEGQVRVSYVLASDGIDEALDTNGRIATSVAAWSSWLRAQTGGTSLRLDTCDGVLDVRFVRLGQTEAALRARGLFIRDELEAELGRLGLLHPNKLEAVYYGGDADQVCGGGPWPPDLAGRVAAVYLHGTFSDPAVPPCASNPVGASATHPGYVDFSMLHELLHALGVVPSCAVHHTRRGHVSDSPNDLMYAGDQPWTPSVLDVGRDDYFGANVAGCLDLSRSALLEPLPSGAERPPGW